MNVSKVYPHNASRLETLGSNHASVTDWRSVNQVYCSVGKRGLEFSLLPWLRRRASLLTAYSPMAQGVADRHPALADIGMRCGLTAAQVALAWVIQREGVVAIPRFERGTMADTACETVPYLLHTGGWSS